MSTDVDFYRQFANVENDIDQALNEAHNQALEDIDEFDEISNLCNGSDNETEIDQFENYEIDIVNLKRLYFQGLMNYKKKLRINFAKYYFMP